MGFRYVPTNLSKRRKELFPLSLPQIKRKTTPAGAIQATVPPTFMRAPQGANELRS